MTTYDKTAFSLPEHITLLKQRGLQITDESLAEHYLTRISYFRLSAYTRVFYRPDLTGQHQFQDGTGFEQVVALYNFDRELRLLLLDALERLEVGLRAHLGNRLAEHYGPHGYLNPDIFNSGYNHNWLLDKLQKEARQHHAEMYLKHYRSKYPGAPEQPPVWMAMELLTFKEVSTLFSNLRQKQDTQAAEQYFGWKYSLLKSWFRALSDLRNTCAHHARVWNREFGSRPEMPRKITRLWPDIPNAIPASPGKPEQTIDSQKRLYALVAVMEALMFTVNPESRWSQRLQQLLDRHPEVSKAHMGFPENWQQQPFWQRSLQPSQEQQP